MDKEPFSWDQMDYWQSEDWQQVQELLDAEENINPARENLFLSLDAVPYSDVRCILVGQDPYPDPQYATGHAFATLGAIPPTLKTIYKELVSDLHVEFPTTGKLGDWISQGVLLWNAIPSCRSWQSMSHDWMGWHPLSREIIQRLSQKGIVFVFLGGRARELAQYVDPSNNVLLEFSHPSPRASRASYNPFVGSRMFSKINQGLCKLKLGSIDWRLP